MSLVKIYGGDQLKLNTNVDRRCIRYCTVSFTVFLVCYTMSETDHILEMTITIIL